MQLSFKTASFILLTLLNSMFCEAGKIAKEDSNGSQQNNPHVVQQQYNQFQQHLRQALLDSIQLVRDEMEQLQSVIERGTFGVPSYYFTNLRSWIIPSAYPFNDTLSQYFFEASENDSTFIQQRGDIQIIATSGDTVDLVGILFSGNEQEKKGRRLHELLHKRPERNMYQRVLMSGSYGEERLLVDNKFRVTNHLQPRLVKNSDFILTNFKRIDIDKPSDESSTTITLRIPDRAHVQFGPFWGVEVKLGNEEVGYPLWFSGNMSVLATYQRMKIGLQFPFAGGRFVGESVGKILPARKLDGTYGAQAEFDVGFAGGSFMVGLHRSDVDGAFVNSDRIHSLRNFAQLWYSYAVAVGGEQQTNLLRVKLGLGFHQIGFDKLFPSRTVYETGVAVNRPAEILPTATIRSFWSPYLNVDFMNQRFAHRFGASLQYYNEWGVITAWLEVVRDRVRIELKGAAPLLRTHQAWEPSYLAMLSIPLTFSLLEEIQQ